MAKIDYLISRNAHTVIEAFYVDMAAKKSLPYQDISKLIKKTYRSIKKIENGLLCCAAPFPHWEGCRVASAESWLFAYIVAGNTVAVVDACPTAQIL